MKKAIIISAVMFSGFSIAQVGVNTPTPKATFDITAKNTAGTSNLTEGLLAPRVDRQRAQSMNAVETSTLIYVNNISTGSLAGTAINIDSVGFYYFDGSVWVKMKNSATIPANTNIYTDNGTLSANRTVTQGNRTLAFTGTTTNAFSIDGSTFSADAANHRIGIGTTSPTQKFVVRGTNAQPNFTDNATLRIDGETNHALDMGTFADSPYGSYINSNNKTDKAMPLIFNPSGASVAMGTYSPTASALLELSSTNRGFLPPRLSTTQRDALSPKVAGLMIFNTTTKCMENWDTAKWVSKCETPRIIVLNCAGTTTTGTLTSGTVASGVSASVPYTNGDGSTYTAQSVTSTGVTGLTATLNAGNLANGNGTLTYNITGTPNASGTATFMINIKGQTCTFTITVKAATSFVLNCSSTTTTGTLTSGTAATGVSASVPYTDGDGSAYTAQSVTSTGVTGLTATLSAGNLANGNGTLIYHITGTPNSSGTAKFMINIKGQTCTFTKNVLQGMPPIDLTTDCNGTLIGGYSSTFTVNGKSVTSTFTNFYNVTHSYHGVNLCNNSSSIGNSRVELMPESAGTPTGKKDPFGNLIINLVSNGSLTITFSRPITNFKVFHSAVHNDEKYKYTFKRNGVVVNPTMKLICSTGNRFNSIISNTVSSSAPPGGGVDSISNGIYIAGGEWFDEVQISCTQTGGPSYPYPAKPNGSLATFCVGDAL